MRSIDEELTPIFERLIKAELSLDAFLGVMKRKYIALAVKMNRGRKGKAALALGVHRNTILNNPEKNFSNDAERG
jgi:DNA-binding NtrC family response regulator